ncbi:hypothetical protein Q9966_001170 [Columba livia]|nr:hypothetical protein Q9966_001170 [Columba livia]
MIRREDTERAVEILTRYQSTLQSPEEQELKASIGKVSHIFQSELFQALLDDTGILLPPWSCGFFSHCFADIHEFYDFTLRSAPLQPPSRDARGDTARQQHGASKPSSTVIPREPQNLPEDPSQSAEQRLLAGAGDSTPGTPPRLVRVTARRTEAPASVCSLVLGSRSTLLQDFMWRKEKTTRAEMPATPDKT